LYHPHASRVVPPSAPSGPAAPPSFTVKVLKLDSIKDAKAYLDALGIIEFYLWDPDFSPGLPDSVLVSASSNFEASRLWEGQLCLAVKDGELCFLFENKGDTYNGHGFKMLAARNACCHLNSVANAFSSLLSIFNELHGNDEPILAFCSCFNSLILEMACCKVVIPPLLLVMLFLLALHGHYLDIVEQFRTHHNSLETMSIEMIVAGVTYHNKFILKEPHCQEKSSKPPSQIPAVSAAHTDNAGTVSSSPFDWLCKGYGDKGIRTCWKMH
jgi:hypothetical protein